MQEVERSGWSSPLPGWLVRAGRCGYFGLRRAAGLDGEAGFPYGTHVLPRGFHRRWVLEPMRTATPAARRHDAGEAWRRPHHGGVLESVFPSCARFDDCCSISVMPWPSCCEYCDAPGKQAREDHRGMSSGDRRSLVARRQPIGHGPAQAGTDASAVGRVMIQLRAFPRYLVLGRNGHRPGECKRALMRSGRP